MKNLIVRRARHAEVPVLMDMQTKIFSEEQGIPAALVREVTGRDPHFWVAVLDGRVVGGAASWTEENGVHLGRFVVTPPLRARHIGRRILRCAFDELFADGAERVHMEARDVTVRLVCAMGGEVVGDPVPFFIGDVTPVLLEKSAYRPLSD